MARKKIEKQDKITPAKLKRLKFEEDREKIISENFKQIPKATIEDKKICSCCGKPLIDDNYWESYSLAHIGRMTKSGKACNIICKNCAQLLFDYYYKTSRRNMEYAIERTCCDINFYWDAEKLKEAKEVYEKNHRKLHILSEYIGAVNRGRTTAIGLTYWDSPTIKNRGMTIIQGDSQAQQDALLYENQFINQGYDTPIDWEKEDAENRKKILSVFRCDPFEIEKEEDKPGLYRDLCMMLDDSMEEDFVKLRAALEIVRSFNKMDKWNKEIKELSDLSEDDPDVWKKMKSIQELKDRELKTITEFSKAHGFDSKSSQNKAKGAGTLSGIMKTMKDQQYERGILNLYDIKTSESIEQAAKASVKAIFDQLSIGNNESFQIIQEQRDQIVKLNKENTTLQEKLRLECVKNKRLELEKEAMKNGVEIDD